MLLRKSAQAVGLLLLAASVALADQPQAWLERMSHAHREVSYQGIVTHQIDDRLSSYRIIHQVSNGQEYELLKALDSQSRDLVRKGHSIHCVHPAERLLRSTEGNGSLRQFYDLEMGKSGRVAGRDVVVLHLNPRDVFRLGYRLALDVQTGIPLKTETLDQQQRVLERFQFMMFELDETPDIRATEAREVLHLEVMTAKEAAQLPWKPNWVPAGFTLAESRSEAVQSLSFTDGISMFSVFLEPLTSVTRSPVAGAMRSGATVSYTYPLPGQDYVATVIGEVPLLTAEQVAKSLEVAP